MRLRLCSRMRLTVGGGRQAGDKVTLAGAGIIDQQDRFGAFEVGASGQGADAGGRAIERSRTSEVAPRSSLVTGTKLIQLASKPYSWSCRTKSLRPGRLSPSLCCSKSWSSAAGNPSTSRPPRCQICRGRNLAAPPLTPGGATLYAFLLRSFLTGKKSATR
jgi:hypothetical protein